jgi:membrane protein YdbS with pleckstrin-like domain
MSPSNWDKEMAKIDKHLESISDETLLPSARAKTPAEKSKIVEKQRTTSTFGVFVRLVLAVALGVGMLFWPYSARCGVGLFAYLGATAMVITAGVWTSVWTWRHRSGQAHVLSLLLIVWGIVLAAQEVLPRVGYAKPDAAHPAVWMCE